jgi:hypothetical protein
MKALVERLMLWVQWATVTLSVGMLLSPAWRISQLQLAVGVLMVTCTFILGWRLHRHGIGHMTLPAIWDWIRKSGGADPGYRPLDLLAPLLAYAVTKLG